MAGSSASAAGTVTVQGVALRVARQRALEIARFDEPLYVLKDDWCVAVLLEDASITKVRSPAELEAASLAPETATLLVVRESALTPEAAKRVLARSGLQKTVFYLE